MSTKIVGWLVGAREGIKYKSGIIKNSGINLVSLVHISPRIFHEFPGFYKNSGISFIVMVITKFWPIIELGRGSKKKNGNLSTFCG